MYQHLTKFWEPKLCKRDAPSEDDEEEHVGVETEAQEKGEPVLEHNDQKAEQTNTKEKQEQNLNDPNTEENNPRTSDPYGSPASAASPQPQLRTPQSKGSLLDDDLEAVDLKLVWTLGGQFPPTLTPLLDFTSPLQKLEEPAQTKNVEEMTESELQEKLKQIERLACLILCLSILRTTYFPHLVTRLRQKISQRKVTVAALRTAASWGGLDLSVT